MLYEEKTQKFGFTPSQRALKNGSENRPWVRGLII